MPSLLSKKSILSVASLLIDRNSWCCLALFQQAVPLAGPVLDSPMISKQVFTAGMISTEKRLEQPFRFAFKMQWGRGDKSNTFLQPQTETAPLKRSTMVAMTGSNENR